MAADTPRDAAIRVMTLLTGDRYRAQNLVDALLAAAQEDCRKALLGISDGEKIASPLTDRQREAVWRLLQRVGDWTESRYDQHLRHDVGDQDTDAILEWLRNTINGGIGDPDIDGPPGDPVHSGEVPSRASGYDVAKLLIAAGLRPDMDVAEAAPLLEVMAKERSHYAGQRSPGPVEVHHLPCDRGDRGECETCHQEELAWAQSKKAPGKKPDPKGPSFFPVCFRCGGVADDSLNLICGLYPECHPDRPNPGPPGSQYCARKSCRHAHRNMLQCTQCGCLVFLEMYGFTKNAPQPVWHMVDMDAGSRTRCGVGFGPKVYSTRIEESVTCQECKNLNAYKIVELDYGQAPKGAEPQAVHFIDRRGQNRCGGFANPATTREADVTCFECTYKLRKDREASQTPGPAAVRIMHWLMPDPGYGAAKTYCGLTQGENVYGTPDGEGADCPQCFVATATSTGQAPKGAEPKLEEAKWALDRDAVAQAHGWRWWKDVVEDAQKDGYQEAGGTGKLAAAIGQNATYAQKLIELVEGYEKP